MDRIQSQNEADLLKPFPFIFLFVETYHHEKKIFGGRIVSCFIIF